MRKGSKHTEETKQKISKTLIGHKHHSPDFARKMILTKKKNGTLSPSPETRLKISIAQKNLSPEKRERINHGIRTKRYNEEYAKKLSDTKLGEINPQAKLTANKVKEIKKLWNTGNYSTASLGKRFQISRQSVADIVKGRTWKHVNVDED